MDPTSFSTSSTISRDSTLRIGFVALNDSAPFIVARELGLFRKFEIKVELSREAGWATIRDKIVCRQLDAAHALGTMPFAATLGLGSIPCSCLTGLVLNLGGNGITLSRNLYDRGAVDSEGLRNVIRRDRGERIYTFGAVFPHSSHWTLLRRWLLRGGIDPDRDVKVVIVPPSLLFRTLATGHIDGYCVGEPWNTLAAQRRIGVFVAHSDDIEPRHPEKVLMVRKDLHDTRREEHINLIAALLEACRFCDDPANRDDLVRLLAKDGRIGVSEAVLRQSFEGRRGPSVAEPDSANPERRPMVFHGKNVNRPDTDKARWILDALLEDNRIPKTPASPAGLGTRTFREDIYNEACERTAPIISQ